MDDRKDVYDRLSQDARQSGVNVRALFADTSYFRRGTGGETIPLAGHHPTLVHWPLAEYGGGVQLLRRLREETGRMSSILGDSVAWISPNNWHSTVFNPVHSSDPEVIRTYDLDVRDRFALACQLASPYRLDFRRILLTPNAGLKVAAYPCSDELDTIRRRLNESIPAGRISSMVHISLGNIVKQPSSHQEEDLIAYLDDFSSDIHALGEIDIPFLTLAEYHAPFISMCLKEHERFYLQGRR